MPRQIPRNPAFANNSERLVWQQLNEQLEPDDVLIANQHLTADKRDHEIDLVVVFDGVGVVVVEVKGSGVEYQNGVWTSPHKIQGRPYNPVGQARDGKHALRDWLRGHTSFDEFGCWVHTVVLPFVDVVPPDAQRWQIAGSAEMAHLADFLKSAITKRVDKPYKALSRNGRDILIDALSRPPMPPPDIASNALEREAEVD